MENFYSYVSVIVVSLISLIGIVSISIKSEFLDKITFILISLATGTFLGEVFLHIIPHSEGNLYNLSVGILVGIICFYILESILHWHHCHNKHDESKILNKVAVSNLLADGIHNFLDGVIIASSFNVSVELGIASTIAIILHEIPQELSDFGILVKAGYSVKKAIFFNFISSLSAILGVLFTYLISNFIESIEPFLISFSAGAFIYIAMSDLIPELKHENNVKKAFIQLAVVLFGILIMHTLTFIEIEHVEHGGENEEEIELFEIEKQI